MVCERVYWWRKRIYSGNINRVIKTLVSTMHEATTLNHHVLRTAGNNAIIAAKKCAVDDELPTTYRRTAALHNSFAWRCGLRTAHPKTIQDHVIPQKNMRNTISSRSNDWSSSTLRRIRGHYRGRRSGWTKG